MDTMGVASLLTQSYGASSMPDDPSSPNGGTRSPSASADGAIEASLDRIHGVLADLARATGREHDRAVHRERVIDRLHEENQRLRHNETQTAFEPVRTSLYRLYDLVRRESERETADPAHVPKLLAAIADELAEIIARTGVERMPVDEGDAFDPARHRPAGTRDVDDVERDGTVVTVQRTGFVRGEKVVRRAEVIVARTAADPAGGD
jgi:molecular chaperone GrpE (heat shock protein)